MRDLRLRGRRGPGHHASASPRRTHEHGHGHGHDHGHSRTTGLTPTSAPTPSTSRSPCWPRTTSWPRRNRAWLAERGITALNLMSSPGAGKTTLLERTIAELGRPVIA